MSGPAPAPTEPAPTGSVDVDRPDWEALAPVWHALEDGGLNRHLLLKIAPLIEPPLLYVGCGTGQLTDLLRDRLGSPAVVSLDRSWGMARRAGLRPGLRCLVADVAALPFAGRSFATVLCASGVLEFLSPDERGRALTEMARVCHRPGQLLTAAASGDGTVVWDVDQHALPRAWYAHRLPAHSVAGRAFDAVAREVGGREPALALLLSSLPRRGRSLTTSVLTETAARAGLPAPRRILEEDGTGVWRWPVLHPA